MVATGRSCTPNRIYTYRMLDTAYGEIAALFADWQAHKRTQVGRYWGASCRAYPSKCDR
jgi:hypothetical protein